MMFKGPSWPKPSHDSVIYDSVIFSHWASHGHPVRHTVKLCLSRWQWCFLHAPNQKQKFSQGRDFPPPPFFVWPLLTFIAVPHCAKVNIVLVIGEEQETEPWVKGVNGHNEEDPNNVALFIWAAIAAKMHVDLRGWRGETRISGICNREEKVELGSQLDYQEKQTQQIISWLPPQNSRWWTLKKKKKITYHIALIWRPLVCREWEGGGKGSGRHF